MDQHFIQHTLKALLITVAEKAKADAQQGESDIGSIFEDSIDTLPDVDVSKIEQAIRDIDKATATKEGARRLMNGILIAARVAAKAVFPA